MVAPSSSQWVSLRVWLTSSKRRQQSPSDTGAGPVYVVIGIAPLAVPRNLQWCGAAAAAVP